MPKIFTYLGIVLFFYSDEHEPIHVHAKYQGKETKAEILMRDGKIYKIVIKDKGPGIDPAKKQDLADFLTVYAEDIVELWIDYFVRQKRVKSTEIRKKVRAKRNVRIVHS